MPSCTNASPVSNQRLSRTVYSVGEAIRLQRETLNWCWDRLGKSYLRAAERESLRSEIARVLQITMAAPRDVADDIARIETGTAETVQQGSVPKG